MAKKNPKQNERRAMVEKMRAEQARKEKMRSYLIFGFCLVVVAGLLAAALIPYLKDRSEERKLAGTEVSEIGASESAAACDPIVTRKTDQSQQHIPSPTPIEYKDAPPSFGSHRPQSASFERAYYTAEDRPEIAELVHNLEHGYVIVWYDETIAKDKEQLDQLKAIADKYNEATVRFKVAPWTAEDGAAFPEGKHIALTRWSADAEKPTDQKKQRGNWQYCGSTSGEVISSFVDKWSNAESPEPNVM